MQTENTKQGDLMYDCESKRIAQLKSRFYRHSKWITREERNPLESLLYFDYDETVGLNGSHSFVATEILHTFGLTEVVALGLTNKTIRYIMDEWLICEMIPNLLSRIKLNNDIVRRNMMTKMMMNKGFSYVRDLDIYIHPDYIQRNKTIPISSELYNGTKLVTVHYVIRLRR